jgi:hypothetical protein
VGLTRVVWRACAAVAAAAVILIPIIWHDGGGAGLQAQGRQLDPGGGPRVEVSNAAHRVVVIAVVIAEHKTIGIGSVSDPDSIRSMDPDPGPGG